MRSSVPILILAAFVALAEPMAAQVPATFTNLQVLPKDIRQRPLVDLMRSFALGLGVRCEFCHVGEGNDLSKFDFASDARPQKLTARKMLKMLAAVNEQLAGVGDPPAPGAAKVTCFTCHRGARKPATTPPGLAASPSPPAMRR
jgi:hypothetical protein